MLKPLYGKSSVVTQTKQSFFFVKDLIILYLFSLQSTEAMFAHKHLLWMRTIIWDGTQKIDLHGPEFAKLIIILHNVFGSIFIIKS